MANSDRSSTSHQGRYTGKRRICRNSATGLQKSATKTKNNSCPSSPLTCSHGKFRSEFDKPSRTLYGQAADLPQFRHRVAKISYEDEKQFLPLQSADLLAWQIQIGIRQAIKDAIRASGGSAAIPPPGCKNQLRRRKTIPAPPVR